MRILPAQAQANDVTGGVGELLGQVAVTGPVQHDVQGQGADQLKEVKIEKKWAKKLMKCMIFVDNVRLWWHHRQPLITVKNENNAMEIL